MTTPLLAIAANGHNWLTFEDIGTPQWVQATDWLKQRRFEPSGDPVIGLDEGILPSFVRHDVVLLAGFDHWSGNYLLASCAEGDLVVQELAQRLACDDRRPDVQ